jgi:hypothetical protein
MLNCTANQVENLFRSPSLSWIGPDGRNVPTDEGSNPRVGSQTKLLQLIFSGITTINAGSYSCRATINIPEAQIVNYFNETTIFASNSGRCNHHACIYSSYFDLVLHYAYIVPGMIENLTCDRSFSASELTFTWDSPNTLQGGVLEYRVEVKELHHRAAGMRDVVQFSITGFNTEMRLATINQGISKHR